ncbi:hypothetical protein BB559_003296 [Furculomyces boomerangus]|uniref:Uncharacterized protein n=2 Tax=Harpellales TaxID=61421 RepID=A0A2T9YM33_9FUNG|nr:hypothetical protein BB559_003296 [Furculomyces boomerangus]PWA00276.1 hypothetical protein BB558_003660 [Smittium angustum]
MASYAQNTSTNVTVIGVKNPNDVVVVSTARTPLTRANKGLFRDTEVEYLLSTVLRGVVEKVGLDPALVEDIVVGTVTTPGGGSQKARMALLYAGFPETTASMCLDRQCSSGLHAVGQIVSGIRDGTIEIGIGAGVEVLSKHYKTFNKQGKDFYDQEILAVPTAKDSLAPVGILSDEIAEKYNVSREDQDYFSALSHAKAAFAQKNGYFKDEIIPVKTKIINKDGSVEEVIVTEDDGIRPGTTPETLAKLKPYFNENGTTTAGNASQVTDGAAAVLLMKRSRAIELGLPIMGKVITSAVVGFKVRELLISPIDAIPLAVKKAGITIDDLEIIELNEAFASQSVHVIQSLGIDILKVNPKGGAVALGHPFGCTGARQIGTLLTELKRTNKRVGAVTMCAGYGNGMCTIFESEH